MLAAARWLVERQLLDEEVLLADADDPRGARQVAGEQRDRPLLERRGNGFQPLSQPPLFRCHSSSSWAEKTRNSGLIGSAY